MFDDLSSGNLMRSQQKQAIARRVTLIPEPAMDLAAQVAAMLDPTHPKRAVFFAPGNERSILHVAQVVSRLGEGSLLTTDAECAKLFDLYGPQDALMAWILGYPEDKAAVAAACWAAACRGEPVHLAARVVQARDADGSVVSEAVVSLRMLDEAKRHLADYVPSGGGLVVMMPVEAIARRLLLRAMERWQSPMSASAPRTATECVFAAELVALLDLGDGKSNSCLGDQAAAEIMALHHRVEAALA